MKKINFLTLVTFFSAVIFSQANAQSKTLIDGISRPYKAKEIVGIENWINSKPLTISELKGKVILVDFWTYSCINCLRTLPHINKWHDQYRDKGLVIIGVHSPEFEFEKNFDNVKKAVERFGIKYPVAMDSHLSTWMTYKNKYWPAHYLIDKEGNVVYTHFGEGDYETTENNIRALLGVEEKMPETQAAEESNKNTKSLFSSHQTPETYLGYLRSQNFYSPEKTVEKTTNFSFPDSLPNNSWALGGKWIVGEQRIISKEKGAKLRLNFTSKKVFLVMGSPKGKKIEVSLKLDDQNLANSPVIVDKHMLFELVNQEKIQNALLEITASDSGLEAYAFTFGE